MRAFIAILFCFFVVSLHAQDERKYVREGNQLYKQGKLNDAEEQYAKAITKNSKSPEANYDLGSVFLKQDSVEKAAHQFGTAAELTTDPKIKAKAYYNEGNSYLQGKNYEEAATAYKNSLINDPKDEDARYNLAYAQRMLKQQQQKQKNQKNKDQKDQKNQQNQKNQQSAQNNQGQDQKNQDKKNGQQNKDQQDKKEGQSKEEQAQQGEDKDQKGQPGKVKVGMTKEQAEKLLEALRNEEQKVQYKLEEKKVKPQTKKIEKDW